MTTATNSNRKRLRNMDDVNRKSRMFDHKFATAGTTCTAYPKTVEYPSESLDITVSWSPTSNREEVSWSSSEGSTYYSNDDDNEISLRQQGSISRLKESFKLTKANGPKTGGHSHQSTNVVRTKKCAKKIINNNDNSDRMKTIVTTTAAATEAMKNRGKPSLKNIDVFTEIEIATSGEDLSTIYFLTTEDTEEVFCKSIVPFEVKTTNTEVLCGISAISISSIDESCMTVDCSKSDLAVRYHREIALNSTESGTECLTFMSLKSKTTHVSNNQKSCSSVNKNMMDFISVNCQESVSSLESMSTWDDLSLDSDVSARREHGADKFNLQQNWDNSHQEENTERQPSKDKSTAQDLKTAMSLRIDSKVHKIKKKIQQKQQSNLTKDQKIKELKMKIRNMQQESFMDNKKLSSRAANISKGNSSTEIDGSLSSSLSSRQIEDEENNEQEDELRHCNKDAITPLIKKFDSRESQHKKKSISTRRKIRRSQVIPKRQIHQMIPVVDRESISVMERDVKTNIDLEFDIEIGQPSTDGSTKYNVEDPIFSTTCRTENNISDRTKTLPDNSKTKADAGLDSLLLYLVRKRNEFDEKPKNEQIVISAMVALSFAFFILILVTIVQ